MNHVIENPNTVFKSFPQKPSLENAESFYMKRGFYACTLLIAVNIRVFWVLKDSFLKSETTILRSFKKINVVTIFSITLSNILLRRV